MFVQALPIVALLATCGSTIWFAHAEESGEVVITREAIERDPNQIYSEEENFRYINEVLAKLNNNEQCTLPSWDEVDELQRSYVQLEEALGGQEQLLAKLNKDQKLVQDTLLDQWTLFQQRMTAGVVIKSSKKRAFLGKVEKYQEAKFGSSVCTRHVDNNEVTNQIFVKNPIVRYVHHIQSGRPKDVPDFPAAEDVEPQVANDEPEKPQEQPQEEQQQPQRKIVEIPITDGPVSLTIEYTPINNNQEDPLTDIPVPSVDDKAPEPEPEPEPKAEPQPEPEPEPEPQPEPEPEPEPQPEPEPEPKVVEYDPNAPEMVEPEVDEADLAKLDKPEPKEWDFDYENGELKWPDEVPPSKFDESDDLVLKDWAKFLENPQLCVRADGTLYDCTKGRHNLAAKPGVEQRRRDFVHSVKVHMDQKQLEDIIGWHPDRWSPEAERRVRVPPGQREPPKVRADDEWSYLYSGRFCRISYNKKNILDSRGSRAIKTLFGKDEYSKKKKMLARSDL